MPDSSLITSTLIHIWRAFLGRVPYIVIGIFVFGLFYLAGLLVKKAVRAIGHRTRLDEMLSDLLGRLTSLIFALVGILVAFVVIFPAFKPGDLIAGLGITSIAAGVAFKDILKNFLAGTLILWRRPFRVGDEIRTDKYEGTVTEINVRATLLRTYDGERAIVPNGEVYMNAILVRTAFPHRRVRFTVGIGYEDSIEEARLVIFQVLKDAEGVLIEPGPWVYVDELAPSSVNLAVYFWAKAEQANILKVSDSVATNIKLALDKAGIDMPYPHVVTIPFDRISEEERLVSSPGKGTRRGDP